MVGPHPTPLPDEITLGRLIMEAAKVFSRDDVLTEIFSDVEFVDELAILSKFYFSGDGFRRCLVWHAWDEFSCKSHLSFASP